MNIFTTGLRAAFAMLACATLAGCVAPGYAEPPIYRDNGVYAPYEPGVVYDRGGYYDYPYDYRPAYGPPIYGSAVFFGISTRDRHKPRYHGRKAHRDVASHRYDRGGKHKGVQRSDRAAPAQTGPRTRMEDRPRVGRQDGARQNNRPSVRPERAQRPNAQGRRAAREAARDQARVAAREAARSDAREAARQQARADARLAARGGANAQPASIRRTAGQRDRNRANNRQRRGDAISRR